MGQKIQEYSFRENKNALITERIRKIVKKRKTRKRKVSEKVERQLKRIRKQKGYND